MFIDLTFKITPKTAQDAQGNLNKALVGHLGTHFDVMNKEFPLEYARRKGTAFDISGIRDRDVEPNDIDLSGVKKDMFVAFYSGYIEEVPYGSKPYFADHPQLSKALIDELLDRGVSLIGIDFAGVRKGREHTSMDQYCADHGVFIIENMVNLKSIVGKDVMIYTFPMNYSGITGLPCRILAE